jgi:hypothetical protein
LATQQNALVAVWLGEPDPHHLSEAVAGMEKLHLQFPGRVLMLNVIGETAGMPNAATREALRGQFEQMRGKLAAAAVVIEHRGVLHSLSRAIVTSLVTISRQPFPLKVFGDRGLAAEWLATHRGAPDAAALTALALQLERRMREQRATG